jgi:hypothetical protein
VARLKFSGPATEETWVTGAGGDPVFMVIAELPQSLAGQLRGLLSQLRQVAGEGRRMTVCFDRGGWAPALFADIARALDGHYARARDEAYALIREALATSGDIRPGPG